MGVTVKKIKELFDAEVENPPINRDEYDFLKKRSEIEQNLPNHLSLSEFMDYYHLINEYGLTDQLLKKLEGEIWYKANYESQSFRKSKFHSLFKDHKLVKKYLD